MRKQYGQSKNDICCTCGSVATLKNKQGMPSCRHHKDMQHNMKCLCKEWLDVKESKYGTFFLCVNCGAISYAKGLEINGLPLPSVHDL